MGFPSKNWCGFAKPATLVTSKQSSKHNRIISDYNDISAGLWHYQPGHTSMFLAGSHEAIKRKSKSCYGSKVLPKLQMNSGVSSAFVAHENEEDLEVSLKMSMDC
jgi:hypothetical protein